MNKNVKFVLILYIEVHFSLNGNTVIGYIVSYTEIIIIYAKRKDLKIEAIVYTMGRTCLLYRQIWYCFDWKGLSEHQAIYICMLIAQ